MNVGQREGASRLAHVLCELLVHLRAVGLAGDYACELPITQTELGAAFGITTLHVNRVLQQMRADDLIEMKGTRLTVPDWDRLKEWGKFNPLDLHLE